MYNSFDDLIENHMVCVRFSDKENLRDIIDFKLKRTKGCGCLFVKDIDFKSYYDNDFQDWEVMLVIGNAEESLYDVTLYYTKSRVGLNVIVETYYEKI